MTFQTVKAKLDVAGSFDYMGAQSDINSDGSVFVENVLEAPNKVINVTTNKTQLVKTGAGILKKLSVNKVGTTSQVILYDGIDATGTVLGTFTTLAQGVMDLNIAVTTGICAVTSGGSAADISVMYL